MDSLHQLREIVRVTVKRYDSIIRFVLQFVVGMVIFSAIMGIGFYNPAFAAISRMGFLFVAFMGVLFALLPLSVNYVLIIVLTAVQFSANLEISLIVLMGLVTLFLLFGQFSKRENALVLALLMGFVLGVPYVVPVVAGLYFGITSIIPLAVGALIFSYSRLIFSLSAEPGTGAIGLNLDMITDMDLDDLFGGFMELYQSFSLDSEPVQQWLFMTIALFVVFIFVYIVSRLPISYGKELAIGLGGLISLFAFLFVHAFVDLDIHVGMIVLMSVLSTLGLLVFNYMSIGLDYNKAGRVEFSDDDFYYYVKYVPKMKTVEQRQREAAEKSQPTKGSNPTNPVFLDDDEADEAPLVRDRGWGGSDRGKSQVAATRERYERDQTSQRAVASSKRLLEPPRTRGSGNAPAARPEGQRVSPRTLERHDSRKRP